MKVVDDLTTEDGGKGLVFFCRGCGFYHSFLVEHGTDTSKPIWTWNGDYEKPTFTPSLGVNMTKERRCHLYVRDGQVQYLNDCYHALRGLTVPMQEISW